MAAQKQNWPSFSSVISVLAILFSCAGFLRVELELQNQKKRLDALENVGDHETVKLTSNGAKFVKDAENQYRKLHRHRRQAADSIKNTTEIKTAADTMLKINKLLSEGRLQLCQSQGVTSSSGPPGPPGPPGPRGQKGTRGRRGQNGRPGNNGDKGIMGSPGKSGKQGNIGPVGPPGEAGPKGQKGDVGPTGMPGAKGEPGESISAPVVAVSPANLTVNESGVASFQCSANGNPKPTVMWSKLSNQSQTRHLVDLGGKMILKNVQASDSGTYSCSAANILGQAHAMVQLQINVRPRVLLHTGPHYAIQGNNYTFPTCLVAGHPAPVVTWRKSSGQLPQGRVKYNNSNLQILHVRKTDSDTYFCSAFNSLGHDEKKALFVVVSLPRFTIKPPEQVVAGLGGNLTLICSAIGDPQPLVKWKKQGGQLPVGRSQQIHGSLVIKDIKITDTGNYTCVATSLSSVVFNVKTETHTEVTDVNECSASPSVCDVKANCQNNEGSYICSCESGFTGDGKRCKDINECSASPSVCDVKANCQNNEGSYICSCKPGFTGDGKTCKDINECSASPSVCDAKANCQNNEGSYICSCKPGFTGDGKSCKAAWVTATSSCANLLVRDVKNTSGIIQSGASSSYSNNMDCHWNLSSNSILELVFSILKTAARADYVAVYDGDSTSSTLIGKFSGSSLPGRITSSSNKLHVRFKSDSTGQALGFRARFQAITAGSLYISGSTLSTGRVEIFYNNQWGTICDNGWNMNAANVVCRQLGFPKAFRAFSGARHGQGSGPIWMDHVACSGSESHIYDCSHRGWGNNDCAHSKDVSVECLPIRLADGGVNFGRVEVFYKGIWGTVCDDGWDMSDAQVVCRQLGFRSASSAPDSAKYGQGSDPIWMDDVACQGGETSLFDCTHAGWGIENCSHSEDASVVCTI